MKDQYWHNGGISGLYVRAGLRTLQFIFAIVVAGIYGTDLANATKTNSHANSGWVFAEVVAFLSATTCAVHCFVTVKRVAWCTWDFILVVLWAAQTGVFGTIYINKQDTDTDFGFTTSVDRMRSGVWIDFFNMLLWFASFTLGIVWCCSARKVTRRTDMVEIDQEAQRGDDARNTEMEEPVIKKESDEEKEELKKWSDVKSDKSDLTKSVSNSSSLPPRYEGHRNSY